MGFGLPVHRLIEPSGFASSTLDLQKRIARLIGCYNATLVNPFKLIELKPGQVAVS